MRIRILILTLIILKFLTAHGQAKSYFPNLARVSIDTSYKAYFNYDKKNSRLINKTCHSLNKKDPFYCSDSVYADWTIVSKFKNEKLKDSVDIIFSSGMSDDPSFSVYTKSGKQMGSFASTEFYINSSGTIYVSGHVNSMYNRRRKFQIQNDTILEIIQPYYYVGMKGKTLKEITLFKDKVGSEIVAQLPKDYEIEILLADAMTKDFDVDYLFLVKTEFGLVGWLRLTNDDLYGTILKDLFYAGD